MTDENRAAGQGEEGSGGLAEENNRLRYQLADVLTLAGMDPQGLERKIQMLAEVSASGSPQRAASGPIREVVDRFEKAVIQWKLTATTNSDDVREYLNSRAALLGEAPPTSGEADHLKDIQNWRECAHCSHHEGKHLASLPHKCSLCECIGFHPQATPGATVQPQARPMKLEASVECPYDFAPEMAAFAVHTEKGDLVIDGDINLECAEEIAYRINSFEPPHKGGQA